MLSLKESVFKKYQAQQKRKLEDVGIDDDEIYKSFKQIKYEDSKIYYNVTNIISTNRNKLKELFTGDKFYEFVPYTALMDQKDIDLIKSSYAKVLEWYDKIECSESYMEFDQAYEDCLATILSKFPDRALRSTLSVFEVSIPMPYGHFYAAVTKLRDAYSFNKVDYEFYAAARNMGLKKIQRAEMTQLLYNEVISPSDESYNTLDLQYLQLIEVFRTTYAWMTPKFMIDQNAGLNLDVDRYKIYVKMGELCSNNKEDLIEWCK